MLINQDEKTTLHVEFVNYTGEWPSLCSGILTLKIDGEIQKFGYRQKYPRFWRSGGHCSMSDISEGEWVIDVSILPEEFRNYAEEIDNVFNTNVKYGCCGGCR